MIASGLLFLPFNIGLGFAVPKFIGERRDNRRFVYGVLATFLLFSLAIGGQPEGSVSIPREITWIGVVCVLIYLVFLTKNPRQIRDLKVTDFLRVDSSFSRPVFWMMPISEWLVVIVSTLWYLSTALGMDFAKRA